MVNIEITNFIQEMRLTCPFKGESVFKIQDTAIDKELLHRLLKTAFPTTAAYEKSVLFEKLNMFLEARQAAYEMDTTVEESVEILDYAKWIKADIEDFFEVEPYSFSDVKTINEAFSLSNSIIQQILFMYLPVRELFHNLEKTRVKVDGIPVKRKVYSEYGEFMGWKDSDNVYETWVCDGNQIGIDRELSIIKCWCPSSMAEYHLWTDGLNNDKPLEAIASTFIIHEKLIPFIQELKRQGDVLLVEMKENDIVITDEDKRRPLTADEYFGLLTTEV